ncbi:MAG: SfiI family type II restriction endonuclease [Chloroflexi bacterium]|nr:SfiI family type II restriction endonuclease [Chloroflexota bacterium]
MTLDPASLEKNLDLLENIEKATLRLVVQAICDFRTDASDIFLREQDLVADIGEDITREALDRLGTSAIPLRLFGKIDYKKARYIFHPDYSVRQALFVDSKAEKEDDARSITIQTAQTSMMIRQKRGGADIQEAGTLPKLVTAVLSGQACAFLTTTIFVKYTYREKAGGGNELVSIRVVCLPNGMLQERYNPSVQDTIWLVGRNAPSRGEVFRVRIGLQRLKDKANWRVQCITQAPTPSFLWDD